MYEPCKYVIWPVMSDLTFFRALQAEFSVTFVQHWRCKGRAGRRRKRRSLALQCTVRQSWLSFPVLNIFDVRSPVPLIETVNSPSELSGYPSLLRQKAKLSRAKTLCQVKPPGLLCCENYSDSRARFLYCFLPEEPHACALRLRAQVCSSNSSCFPANTYSAINVCPFNF